LKGASSIAGLKGGLNSDNISAGTNLIILVGYAAMGDYCISKAAVKSLTESTGMKVNSLSLAGIDLQ